MAEVIIDGQRYAPVNEKEAERLGEFARTFRTEATTYWRNAFIAHDTNKVTGERYGMYDEGDELAPFFSEAFLYNLLGKDEARSVLGFIRQLADLAGVKLR